MRSLNRISPILSWLRIAVMASRQVISAASSDFERAPEPKICEPETSTRKMTVSSRSSEKRFTCGRPVRAVTFQSIDRTSSPGT